MLIQTRTSLKKSDVSWPTRSSATEEIARAAASADADGDGVVGDEDAGIALVRGVG